MKYQRDILTADCSPPRSSPLDLKESAPEGLKKKP